MIKMEIIKRSVMVEEVSEFRQSLKYFAGKMQRLQMWL